MSKTTKYIYYIEDLDTNITEVLADNHTIKEGILTLYTAHLDLYRTTEIFLCAYNNWKSVTRKELLND